jgi:RNA polymerase sigma factor (sigma-70 family)
MDDDKQSRRNLENEWYQSWKASSSPLSQRVIEKELSSVLEQHAQALIYKILRRADKDLLTEAVDKVMLNLPSFKGQSLFTTWAHKVMSSVIYEARRTARGLRKEVGLDETVLLSRSDIEIHDMLSTVKSLLSPEEYALFEALAIVGYTQREAVEELKIPRTTLIRRWKKIVGTLKDAFTK